MSSDPLEIQNVSQVSTPGTTVDGQIRLWEELSTGGRIVPQMNGTTYQWNNDSGLTFTDRPAEFAANKSRFRVDLAQWKLDTLAELLTEYLTITSNLGLPVSSAVTSNATWTDGWRPPLMRNTARRKGSARTQTFPRSSTLSGR